MSGEVAEALPEAEQAGAGAAVEETQATTESVEQVEAEKPAEAKPEKTPQEREIDRLRRGIDRRTRQLAEARAQLGLTNRPIDGNNQASANDSEPLSLTRAQIAQLVAAEAEKLAPTLATQRAEATRKQGVIDSLAKTWGQEKFDEVASDLDEAFGGLMDGSGRPKPAIEAVFEADDPTKVIEWLAHPDNEDEAERISKLTAVQAGKAIARLELRIAEEAKAKTPKVSKAPAPLEPVRGAGNADKDPSTMTDKEFAAWRKAQIKARS